MAVRSVLSSINRVLAGLALCTALSACSTVGPDFLQPDAPWLASWAKGSGGQVSGRGGFTERKPAVPQWWRLFNDPQLNKLVELARSDNLNIRIAGLRVYQARAQLGIAVGEQFPQSQAVGGGYKYEQLSKNESVIKDIRKFVDLDPNFHQWQTGFDASWEIDIWGKFRRGVESARGNLLAKFADYEDAVVTVTGDVASTYVTIREIQQLIAINRQSAGLQRESLRIAEIRFKDGVATELDVVEATALLNNTLATIPKLQSQLTQAKNALSVLIGQPPGGIDRLIGGRHRGIPAAPAEVAIGVPADLLRRRPDIRAAEYQAAAASAQIGVAKADLYPAFFITGGIGLKASDFSDLFKGASLAGLINPGFTWNFLNYGRIINNVRVQDAVFRQAVVNYENTVLNAYSEVETALVDFLKAKQEALYLSRSVTALKKGVKIAVVQYQDGSAAYTRVLDTQGSLLVSQQRLVNARATAITSLISAYKALGGGWIPKNVEGFEAEEEAEALAETVAEAN